MSHWVTADSYCIGTEDDKFMLSLTAPHEYGDRIYLEIELDKADLELIAASVGRELARLAVVPLEGRSNA